MTQLLSETPASKRVSVLLFLFLFFLLPSICFLLLSPFFLPFLPIFLSLSLKKKKSPEAQGWLSLHLRPPPPKSRAISLPIVTGGERVSDPLPQKIPQPLPRPVISFLCRPAREATLPLLLRRSLAVLSELNSRKKGKRLFGRTYPSAANTSRPLEGRETATPPRSLRSFGAQALRFHKGIYRADWRLWGWSGLRTSGEQEEGQAPLSALRGRELFTKGWKRPLTEKECLARKWPLEAQPSGSLGRQSGWVRDQTPQPGQSSSGWARRGLGSQELCDV